MTSTAITDNNFSAKLVQVDIQLALDDQEYTEIEEPPSPEQLCNWANMAFSQVDLVAEKCLSEITIRLVEVEEITKLNRDYRHIDKPTNVLSFPFESFELLDSSDELDRQLLGDIVICHSVIVNEAQQQKKTAHNHYAHMVTHGLLHLCGYDHQNQQTAEQMESLEIKILAQLGIANPY